MCEAWQHDLRQMKQHFDRHHKESVYPSLSELQSAMCSRTGERGSYRPIVIQEPIQAAPDTWRTQSLFAQRSMFGCSAIDISVDTMRSYFPPKTGSKLHTDIRKEVQTFLKWIESQCNEEWSTDIRNRMVPTRGFKPIQAVSHAKYVNTLSAFVYFCRHCPWTSLPSCNSVGGILWSALAEEKTSIRMMYIAFKFFLYSYACMGRGPSSRDLANISADCAYLKYGLRGGFMHHCLIVLDDKDVSSLSDATRLLADSGAFKQVTILKQTACNCMPASSHQPISWTPDSAFSSLTVLAVSVTLTHGTIHQAFVKILEFVGNVLDAYKVPHLSIRQFTTIVDDPTSTHAGEGLVGFNPRLFPERDAWMRANENMEGFGRHDFFRDSYACANHIVAGLHLSAGPGFRGTEDASLLLVNSMTQSPRNIRVTGRGNHTQFCVIPVYSKQRPLSNGQPVMVAKFLPLDLAFLLVRYIYFMKHLEGSVAGQISNCATFLVTNCGRPVEFGSYNMVLNDVFRSIGIRMGISDLRHALEAFARHLPDTGAVLQTATVRNRLYANHSAASSARYGRDDLTVGQIDADILEQDEQASHSWNTQILKHSNRLTDIHDTPDTMLKKRGAGCYSTFLNQADDMPSKKLLMSDYQLHVSDIDETSRSPQVSLNHGDCSTGSSVQASDEEHVGLQLSQLQIECISFLKKAATSDSTVIIPTGSGKTRLMECFVSETEVAVAVCPFQKLGKQLLCSLGKGVFKWPLSTCSEAHCFANARIIVVAIEHCEYNSPFVHFLKRLHGTKRIGRLFFDEVHQLLQADKPDFRPCLGKFWAFRSGLAQMQIHAPLVGLTATLRQTDEQELCQLLTGISQTMPVFRRSCYRPNITMEIIWADNDVDAEKLCTESSKEDAQTVGKTMVFGTTLDAVYRMAAKMGCQAVTSGIPLDVDSFTKTKLIVASSCAGHGLDDKDVKNVSINGVPFDAETLIQWAGRIRLSGCVKLFLNKKLVLALSGRDGRRAELARIFVKNQHKVGDLQRECCQSIDYCEDDKVMPSHSTVIECNLLTSTPAASAFLLSQVSEEKRITDPVTRSPGNLSFMSQVSCERRNAELVTRSPGTLSLMSQVSEKRKEAYISPQLHVEKSTQEKQVSSVVLFGLQDVADIKQRLLAFIASIPVGCCKICYILGIRSGSTCGLVCRKFSGICIRCFQKHSFQDCKNARFSMPGKALCYKCFLPFEKGIGPDMHSGDIGAHCSTPMCDVMSRVAIILFYSNSIHIPSSLHGHFPQFLTWLGTMDKGTGFHGILKLMKSLML